MLPKTSLILSLIAAIHFGLPASLKSAVPSEEADLRGYGKVLANVTSNRSEFICENGSKADILMGKFLADLFWDAGKEHVEVPVNVSGRSVTVHEWKPYGAVMVARNANRVVIVGGTDVPSLVQRLSNEDIVSKPDTIFRPTGPYPGYLDFYDLKSFMAFSHATMIPARKANRWEFTKKFLPGGLIQHRPFFLTSPADGIWMGRDSIDFDLNKAAKNNVMYSLAISTGSWPQWLQNQHPDFVQRDSEMSIRGAEYNRDTLGRETYGLTSEARRQTSLKFLKEVLQTYRDNPVIGGYKLYCGNNKWEGSYQLENYVPIDYSPAAREGYRRWLRDERKYSLAELGERWYGDSKHYQSWDQVVLPADWNGFYGNLNDQSFLIREGWSWKKAEERENRTAESTTTPSFSAAGSRPADAVPGERDPGWIPVAWGPSQARAFLPRTGDLYYKAIFNPNGWQEKNHGKKLYLSCCVNAPTSSPGTFVWINGKCLGEFASPVRRRNGPFFVDVSDRLVPGENCLVMKVANPGVIFGPIFLTTEEPKAYPYLGKHQNARYVDMTEWQVWELNNKVADTMAFVRSMDPDRPMVIPTGSGVQAEEQQGIACARYGGSMHNTGREAYEHLWWPRTGYVGGFYGSSEPSATVKTAVEMSKLLGWMLVDGDSMHSLFWDVNNYIDLEEKTGWFTQNQRLLQLFGKSLPAKPDVVFLRSSRSSTLTGDDRPRSWDSGRGELQESHYDFVYADEGMLERGLVSPYKVLFDTNTDIMEPATVETIRHFVENGGTFVALHETGRHTKLEPDSWPISKLTGFKVVNSRKKGVIHFEKNLPIFKDWSGVEFQGEGTALDYQNADDAKKGGLSLISNEPETVALAKWEDGSVAVGMRQIGKGKVIVLGSSFWRQGRDTAGVWRTQSEKAAAFFDQLFSGLGVQRNATASVPQVWTRKMISKNGLQDWLVAFNSKDSPVQSNLQLAVSEKPSEVWDLVEQKSVPFTYENGWVKIPQTSFEGMATKAYAVKSRNLAGGVAFWWNEKTKYWKSAHVKPLDDGPAQVVTNPVTIPFHQWKAMPDRDNSLSASDDWTHPSFNDSTWKPLKTGLWNYQDDSLENYQGVVLYRSAPFSIPEGWSGHPVTFNVSRNDTAKDFTKGEFYLNGKKIGEFNESSPSYSFKANIDGAIQNDSNVLSAKITGGKDLSGLTGAVWVEREEKIDATISLNGSWQAIEMDYLTSKPVTLPGKLDPNVKYLRREFEIPADWKGRNIYLKAELGNNVLEGALINGRPVLLLFSNVQINLLPYLSANGKNTIELWRFYSSEKRKGQIDVQNIQIDRSTTPSLPVSR